MTGFRCFVMAAAIALVVAPSGAWAQHADETTNQSTTEITEAQTNAAITYSTVTLVSQRIGDFLVQANPLSARPQSSSVDYITGLAAGDEMQGISLWTNASYSTLENDHAPTAYDGDVTAVSIGGDMRLSDQLMLGLSLGYDVTDMETDANSGNSDTDGFSISPYIAYAITPEHSIDVMLGYARSRTDQVRFQTGTRITGDSDTTRRFISANYNYSRWVGLWNLGANAGYVWSRSKRETFTESDNTVNRGTTTINGQFRLGVKAAYWLDGIMPYASLTYEEDIIYARTEVGAGQEQFANDANGFSIALGANIFGDGPLSGGFQVSTVRSRKDVESHTVSANLRYSF